MLAPGMLLNNRYQLNERVAAGGMGEVWRGTDVLLHRGVAVKVLLPTLMSDSEFITRFRTEARMMAAVRHPGIVQVYDYGEDAVVEGVRMDYLVMEYVEGTPLSRRIQTAGKLGVAETMGIVGQAADALQVAHEAGIVHRDVKPSNLLVKPGGAVVLVDFGVARSVGVTGITSTNVVLGSAHFMAPEQAEGKPVSAATDVYALGAVAYCCLTGRPPYEGDSPLLVLTQLVLGEPPTLPLEIPAAASALVLRALEKDPARRFPSASAMADAARSAQNTLAMPAMPGSAMPGSAMPGRGMAGSALSGSAMAGSASPGPAMSGRATVGSATPGPGVAPSPPPTNIGTPYGKPAGNRRRNAVLALIAAVAVIAVAGVILGLSFRPELSAAQIQPPRAGGDAPVLGAGPGDNGPGQGSGRQAQQGAPVQSRGDGAARTPTKGPATISPSAGEPTATGEPAGTAPAGGTVTNPYTPKQICGIGFAVIDQAALKDPGGTVQGRVYLLYNTLTGKNCTATIKTTQAGTASAASAYLEVQGASRTTDSGSFEYYAGPVRAKAAGVCVKWGGSAGGVSYDSPFEHCS